MNPFSYVLATESAAAQAAIFERPTAKFIAGGTNLLDLMKEGVETPPQLVDINRLPLEHIEIQVDGSVRLGALSSNSDVAYHPTIQARYPRLLTLMEFSHFLFIQLLHKRKTYVR